MYSVVDGKAHLNWGPRNCEIALIDGSGKAIMDKGVYFLDRI